jgi:hypothetical protein
MAKRDIHVVPHEEGWATRKEGAERAASVFDNKVDAVEQAREQARRERVDVIIHGRNGKIQDSDSYGNDPFPPRDKKH